MRDERNTTVCSVDGWLNQDITGRCVMSMGGGTGAAPGPPHGA